MTGLASRHSGLIGAVLAVTLLTGVSFVAASDGRPVWRNENGVVGVDQNKLPPYYRGEVISRAELKRLQKQGKAMVAVSAVEYACMGWQPYFDTEAEAEADFEAYVARSRARGAPAPGEAGPSATADPCSRYGTPAP